MCEIWNQQKGYEITSVDLKRILADPLFSEVRGVGMNGGEPTLRRDLAELAQQLISSLPSLRGISLITNGLRPHLVIPRVEELFSVTQKSNVNLDIMLSLDGIGDVHDQVRGRKGNFEAVKECLQYFRLNNIGDSHRLGCTLISENVEDAESLMLWAEKEQIYCRFRVGIPHQRLYTKDKKDPFALSEKQQFHLCNFLDTLIARYEKNNLPRQLFLRNLRNQIAYGMPRANGCTWQSEGVTLLSDGGFAYCAVESPTLGNLVEGEKSASKLYFENSSILSDIITKKCDTCLHDYEGRFPQIKDRIKVLSHQLISKYNLPTFALSGINTSISLVKNILKVSGGFHIQRKLYKKLAVGNNKILIVGWYGTETLGDKAILYSIIQSLLTAGISAKNIVVASIEPYVTKYTLHEMPSVLGCEVTGLSEAVDLAKAGAYRQVIFGGGPLMSSIPYLCDIASIFTSVKKLGGQALVWGCGIGPLRTKKRDYVNKLAIKKILEAADYCVFRDRESLLSAINLSPSLTEDTCSVALDPAFHWVKEVANSLDTLNSKFNQHRAQVGFAIRSLPISEYYSDNEASAVQLKISFEKIISELLEKHNHESGTYLQCMHRLPCGGDDRLFYADLLGDNAQKYGLSLVHENPMDDIKRLASLKSIYAMRFHSVIFALALGIPVVPIDYTNGGKISALCREFQIKCFTPSDLVNHFRSQKHAPPPQSPDESLVKSIVSESAIVYSNLANRVALFATS
jgi:polysaccharide pyruvyl transferase WcaK-like protein/sulfatase maturation enzyme AslB (radical SAM superfamily)